jgi:hypothetical protein
MTICIKFKFLMICSQKFDNKVKIEHNFEDEKSIASTEIKMEGKLKSNNFRTEKEAK